MTPCAASLTSDLHGRSSERSWRPRGSEVTLSISLTCSFHQSYRCYAPFTALCAWKMDDTYIEVSVMMQKLSAEPQSQPPARGADTQNLMGVFS